MRGVGQDPQADTAAGATRIDRLPGIRQAAAPRVRLEPLGDAIGSRRGDRPVPFTLLAHRPVKRASRRSTKERMPSFASSVPITFTLIAGIAAMAAASSAAM